MVKNSLVFLAFCAGLSAQMPTMQAPGAGAPPVPMGDPNAVVISVGDHTITAGQFMEFVKALPQQYQDTARGPGRRDVAKEDSDDTGSGDKGGDRGEFKKGTMLPPFEAAAFAQKVGEVGAPVLSPSGYHIIQVQSHNTKTLADVKPEIMAQMKPNAA